MRRLQCFLCGLVLAAGGLHAWGGGKNSALEALQALQTRIGPEACGVLVALHGQQGQDQPEQWIVLTLNSQSPNLGQQFVISQNGVIDEGVPPGLYPVETPPGFIDRSLVLVDSPYAFQTLNQVAVRAQVAFNSVNYTLVAREYGKEPVWRLEAIDAKGRTAGQVDLSATSGAIYRSIWYYWDGVDTGAAWQGPRIVDSLLSGTAPENPPLLQPGEGGGGGFPLAGAVPERAPVAEPVRPPVPDAQEKDRGGGLFSRLRRNSRPLFGGSSAPVPADPAPETGVAIPVPPGEGSAPTVEVAPAGPGDPAPMAPRTTETVPRGDGLFMPPNR